MFEAEVNVDALAIVSRLTLPEQEVEERVVSGIDPDADIVIAFVPSPLWFTVFVAVTASTHAFSVIVIYLDAVAACPSMVMVKLPVPCVVKPVLFRL